MIGQMMEGVVLPPGKSFSDLPKRDWTAGNMNGRKARHITSIHLVPEELESITRERFARYETVKAAETRFEEIDGYAGADCFAGAECADADMVLVAYGTCARICRGAKKLAEKEGIKLGIFRPITLWPFPYRELAKIAARGKPFLSVEMSLGQLVEDVKLSVYEAVSANAVSANAVAGKGATAGKVSAVHLLGRSGGIIPTEEEVFNEAKKILGRSAA
jgi:2-oxoglutarate ferredoxin oxidoreductase subunit alpha